MYLERVPASMAKNVGGTDQLVRIVLGAVLGLASLAILGNVVDVAVVLSPILGVLSLILLVTGVTSTCGLYSALGISTRQ
jgi:amino acid transporter